MAPQVILSLLKALGVDAAALQKQAETVVQLAHSIDRRMAAIEASVGRLALIEERLKQTEIRAELIVRLLRPESVPKRANGAGDVPLIDYIERDERG